jgi:hypothetical protein
MLQKEENRISLGIRQDSSDNGEGSEEHRVQVNFALDTWQFQVVHHLSYRLGLGFLRSNWRRK